MCILTYVYGPAAPGGQENQQVKKDIARSLIVHYQAHQILFRFYSKSLAPWIRPDGGKSLDLWSLVSDQSICKNKQLKKSLISVFRR